VWKQKLIWDGFIKCCERTVPQSYAVMLQLPHNQLAEFLNSVPKLRDPLLVHVQVKFLTAGHKLRDLLLVHVQVDPSVTCPR
jgi:hypothetical protein